MLLNEQDLHHLRQIITERCAAVHPSLLSRIHINTIERVRQWAECRGELSEHMMNWKNFFGPDFFDICIRRFKHKLAVRTVLSTCTGRSSVQISLRLFTVSLSECHDNRPIFRSNNKTNGK